MTDVSDLLRRIDSLERALANLIRIGTIAQVNGDTADLQTVDIGSLMIDDEHFQKSVLIPVRVPPIRGKEPLYITEISG